MTSIVINSYRFGAAGDADALAFFAATGITDNTIKGAITDLVTDLKAASIWTKFDAIYPFVGGTAGTHKYNLKDPQDTDGAYRLTFNGTVTHDANGITGDGSSGYADTHIVPSTDLLLDSVHLSYYCRTNNTGTYADIGCSDAAVSTFLNVYGSLSNSVFMRVNDITAISISNADSRGFYLGSRTASNARYYQQDVTQTADTQASVSLPDQAIYIAAGNVAGAGAFSDRNYAFASVGSGLTTGEGTTLNTIVVDFQTALSRNV